MVAGSGGNMYGQVRYHIAPALLVLVCTLIVPVLVRVGNPNSQVPLLTAGSSFGWKVVATFFIWAFLSQKVPGSKTFRGPPTPAAGYVPVYAANGTQYYLVTMVAFLVMVFLKPEMCVWIYDDFGSIITCLSLSALVLCAGLLHKGRNWPEAAEPIDPNHTSLYLFYRGVELHPRLLGVDVKQWANCRVGMMGWALLVLIFAVASTVKSGGVVNPGIWVNAVLTNMYLLKFFYWETGYFNTIDIIYDRAGYYLCWGCICWVQILYTFTSFYLVAHPSKCSAVESAAIFVFGVITLFLNYAVDRQKETFKASGGKCHIWGRPAKSLSVTYTDASGKTRKSDLLLSGFWGFSRHMNYVFELLHALSWSLPAVHYGILPFSYLIFLFVLLVHRTYRDDEKCKNKYGAGWNQYCQKVPYKLIPYVF